MKYFILALLIIPIFILGLILLKPKCKEPSVAIIEIITLKCAVSFDEIELRNKVCSELNKANDCDLTSTDSPLIEKIIKAETAKCVEKVLNKNNLCTDKVKEVLDGIR